MNDQAIEQEIQAKGLTAPRVTPADIEANIAAEHYFTAGDAVQGARVAHEVNRAYFQALGDTSQPSWEADTFQGAPQHEALDLLTFCVLVLKNGFTVTGESACASPENFDAELGRKIARRNAIDKLWPLMGYALKERLYRDQQLAVLP